jgi:DNA-binding winged helix-turn-helix (wHTH) protein/tetratricopeptide (TPR) repeat protein
MKKFSPFRLDTVNQCLWHDRDGGDDQQISLTPKAFSVLRYLVEHAGRLVTQNELLEAVWPDTYVQPEVLKSQILSIRHALGDDPKNPRFIETLHRRGYQFIAPIDDALVESTSGPEPPSCRLVGRKPVLRQLSKSLQAALQGQREMVFVTGEPGIGKTALVDEFQRQLATSVPILLSRGQCVEGYGVTEPYYPVLEALSQLCSGPGRTIVINTLVEQAPTWFVQFPALVKREHREMLQREILGATRERMLREICEALETITSENPLLLILEDLHWVDHSTVDLISALAHRRQAAKLMLIGTYRPVDLALSGNPLKALKQDLLIHNLCHEIALEPLGEADVAEYLAGEMAGAAVPDGLAKLIYRHSEGNPLFMVAALEHMTRRGFVSREKEQWKLNVPLEEIDLEVPESLRQMIEIQIDRLSDEEQRVLEVASLESVGRSRFAVVPRAAAGDIEPEAFEDMCEKLSRRHCILRPARPEKFQDGAVSVCYEFVHVLYREVCCRRIAPARRAKLHRRLGQWGESHLEQSNENASWLAAHFEEGRDWPRAVKYLKLAAETAGLRFEPREAAAILKHALELLTELPDKERIESAIEILEKLATIYVACADIRAIETYEALASAAARSGRIDVQTQALINLAQILSWSSSRRALEVYERALQLSNTQSPIPQARTRMSCCFWRMWIAGWNARDAEECRNAIKEIRQVGDGPVLAPHLMEFSFIQWASSEYRQAHRSAIESLGMLFEGEEKNPYLNLVYLIGRIIVPWSLLFAGEWGEALRAINNAIAIMEKNGDRVRTPSLLLIRGWVHLQAMDFTETQTICESVFAMPGHAGSKPQDHICLILAGSAEVALGNHGHALEHFLKATDDMDREMVIHDWYWRIFLESGLADLWLAKGNLAQARSHAERFLNLSMATAERTLQALAWEANARVAAAELDLMHAQECISKALSTIEGFDVPLATWRVHASAAQLHGRTGNTHLAKQNRELSRATILKLADSLAADEALRTTFVSSALVGNVLDDSGTIIRDTATG